MNVRATETLIQTHFFVIFDVSDRPLHSEDLGLQSHYNRVKRFLGDEEMKAKDVMLSAEFIIVEIVSLIPLEIIITLVVGKVSHH